MSRQTALPLHYHQVQWQTDCLILYRINQPCGVAGRLPFTQHGPARFLGPRTTSASSKSHFMHSLGHLADAFLMTYGLLRPISDFGLLGSAPPKTYVFLLNGFCVQFNASQQTVPRERGHRFFWFFFFLSCQPALGVVTVVIVVFSLRFTQKVLS